MDRSQIETSKEHEATEEAPDDASLHPARKLAFRFACIYFLWYAIPDYSAGHDTFLSTAMDRLAAWMGERVFGLGEIDVGFTSSGDRTVHYVKLLVMLAGSIAGALLWTLLDRRRRHSVSSASLWEDRKAAEWLVVAVRFYLIVVMLGYGFAKVFPSQFAPPSLSRLLQPFGDASPMGVLWTAIGYSRAYAAFGGLGEIAGALLLAWRRTTTLGALIIVAVMSNVVMINFSYDVPVKLYSSHLLLMALALVALDWRRIWNVLVLNRPAPAAVHPPHFATPVARQRALAAKLLILALLIAINVREGLENQRIYSRGGAKAPLYGLYDVETFVLDGEVLPPLLTDERRWRNVAFDVRREVGLRMMDGSIEKRTYQVEGANRLSMYRDTEDGTSFTRSQWTFKRPSPETLLLEGELDGSPVSLEMRARDPRDFVLLNRGFNWINETAFDP